MLQLPAPLEGCSITPRLGPCCFLGSRDMGSRDWAGQLLSLVLPHMLTDLFLPPPQLWDALRGQNPEDVLG